MRWGSIRLPCFGTRKWKFQQQWSFIIQVQTHVFLCVSVFCVSAYSQKPNGEKPKETPKKSWKGRWTHGGVQMWLFPLHFCTAQWISSLCGGVQKNLWQHLDHEAGLFNQTTDDLKMIFSVWITPKNNLYLSNTYLLVYLFRLQNLKGKAFFCSGNWKTSWIGRRYCVIISGINWVQIYQIKFEIFKYSRTHWDW